MDTIPTEILIHILSFSIPSKRQRRVRRPLSRVCHLWCTVIYGNPLFWTEVRLHTTTEELREILHRNPDGPLDVIWAPSNCNKSIGDAGMQRVAMISSQSHRWRSLVLAGWITPDIKVHLLEVPTPRLTNFNIVGSFYDFSRLDLAPAGAPLSELTLRWVTLDWEIPRLRGLRCLRLYNPVNKRPTAEQIHAIISSSPGLEILDLASWTPAPHDSPEVKELGAVLLPSLTTLAAENVPSTVLQMLLSRIQAPNCRYIRFPSISPIMFQNNDILEGLAKLCRGPFSTVPRLLVSYDLTSGSCIIAHRDTGLTPQPYTRESSIKLARRRGVYLRTEPILDPVPEGDALRSSEAGVRKFIKQVVQPALRDLSVEIQLNLHQGWFSSTFVPSESVVRDLLLNLPLVTHLQTHSHFDYMNVLSFLSTCQPVGTIDGEALQELSWPVPLMETLVVAWNPRNQAVFEILEVLISKRGPRIQVASEQANECGDGAPHPPRPLKHIIVQNSSEVPLKMWDSAQGWREC